MRILLDFQHDCVAMLLAVSQRQQDVEHGWGHGE
jgi:hypothetical protein